MGRVGWGEGMKSDSWEARPVGTGGALDALPDGSVLYSRGAPHEISRYEISPDGEVLGHPVAAMEGLLSDLDDGDVLVRGTDPDWGAYTTFNIWYPQSRAVFGLSDGRILNVITRSDGDQPPHDLAIV